MGEKGPLNDVETDEELPEGLTLVAARRTWDLEATNPNELEISKKGQKDNSNF